MQRNTNPRVDPRVLRTRQLIKDAFIDLLQEMVENIERIMTSTTPNQNFVGG